MLEARARISPEEAHALGRFLVAVARLLARMGYGWATLSVLGVLCAGWAAYTAPTWWNTIREWMDQ